MNTDHESLSDEELANRVRTGDDSALGVLWARHSAAGRTAARQFDTIADADDLVADAYLAILRALRAGGGPQAAFRPYLYRTIRNIAYTRARADRPVSLELVGDMPGDCDFETESAENGIASQAFHSLPDRWQSVLWYTEVEGMMPAEAATHLGMTANGVSALAYRAREGLRRAWLQAHVNLATAPPGCRWTTARMGDYVRDALTPRARARFDAHLVDCTHCRLLLVEITGLERNLAMALLPAVLGTGAALTLLASRPEGVAVAASSPTAVTAPAGSGFAALVAPADDDAVPEAEPTSEPEPEPAPEVRETTDPAAPPAVTPKPAPTDDAGDGDDDGSGDGDRIGILMVPSPPTLSADLETAVYLPTLTGTGTPGLRVRVETVDGDPLGWAVVDRDGRWSVLLDDPGRSDVEVVAWQGDERGIRSDASAPVPLRFERPVIHSPADRATIASAGGATEVDVEFGGVPGRQVEVLLDGVATGNIHTLGDEPLRRVTPPLADGTHTLTFRYLDPVTGMVGASVTVAFVIAPAE